MGNGVHKCLYEKHYHHGNVLLQQTITENLDQYSHIDSFPSKYHPDPQTLHTAGIVYFSQIIPSMRCKSDPFVHLLSLFP